jgi:16S rRNA (adenine1518-N6/adenine1519-N6)-dimethyltransferase
MDLCNVKEVKQIMEMFNLSFRKEFGQNFLINPAVVEDIADSCGAAPGDTVLEIGPGIGTLTQRLASRYRQVISVEIDRGLIPVLNFTLTGFPNVKVINADVLKADLKEILEPAFAEGGVSVCANLPYYITTPILMELLESGLPFDSITVMLQSEVAARLCAAAGSSEYGAITAVMAYYGTVHRLFTVAPGNFVPPPSVTSTVIRIDLYKERPYQPKSEELLFRTIKAAFEQRRKTLLNALSSGIRELSKEALAQAIADCGFRPDIRGEKLDIADFVRLSDRLFELRAAAGAEKGKTDPEGSAL